MRSRRSCRRISESHGASARGDRGRIADREVPRRADHCIAICRELVGFLRARGVGEQAIEVIAPGGSPEEFPACSVAEAATIRARFGFGERPVLLYTGNVDGYQNLELLLASIGLVRRTIGDALLVLATHATPHDLPTYLRRLPPGRPSRHRRRLRDGTRPHPSGRPGALSASRVVRLSDEALELHGRREGGRRLGRLREGGPPRRERCHRRRRGPGRVCRGDPRSSRDPGRRRQLGAAARRTVEDEYGWERVIDQSRPRIVRCCSGAPRVPVRRPCARSAFSKLEVT
jgi:glycosyltransferase involved in cell wall biosynthesis